MQILQTFGIQEHQISHASTPGHEKLKSSTSVGLSLLLPKSSRQMQGGKDLVTILKVTDRDETRHTHSKRAAHG